MLLTHPLLWLSRNRARAPWAVSRGPEQGRLEGKRTHAVRWFAVPGSLRRRYVDGASLNIGKLSAVRNKEHLAPVVVGPKANFRASGKVPLNSQFHMESH